MKPIEERIEMIFEGKQFTELGRETVKASLEGLAADLQAEQPRVERCFECNGLVSEWVECDTGMGRICRPCETIRIKNAEVAELRKALEVEISERDRLREQLRFSADDNLVYEVKSVLGDLTNRLEHSLTGDLDGAVEQELTEVKEMVDQLLTRLGGA